MLEVWGETFNTDRSRQHVTALWFATKRNELIGRNVTPRQAMSAQQWINCKAQAEAAARTFVSVLLLSRNPAPPGARAGARPTAASDSKQIQIQIESSETPPLESERQLYATGRREPANESPAEKRLREAIELQSAIELDRLLRPQSDANRWSQLNHLLLTDFGDSLSAVVRSIVLGYEGSWEWCIALTRFETPTYLVSEDMTLLDRLIPSTAGNTTVGVGGSERPILYEETTKHTFRVVCSTRVPSDSIHYSHLTQNRSYSGDERRVRLVSCYAEQAVNPNGGPPTAPLTHQIYAWDVLTRQRTLFVVEKQYASKTTSVCVVFAVCRLLCCDVF